MPAQPGEMRPSRETSVISAMTSPAPPAARAARCVRWKSFGVPSTAEYMHIGETTTRFGSTRSRSLSGVNIAGVLGVVLALRANQLATSPANFVSRSFRLSYVMRLLRVRRLNANCVGSRSR